MSRLYCIMGKSASGKDKIYRALLQDETLKLQKIVIYTTRPIREKEVQGREYHFTDQAGFDALQAAGKVIESRRYDTFYGPWIYFTADDGQIDLDSEDYLIINTPEAFLQLKTYFGEDRVVPLYVEVEDAERLLRAIQRELKSQTPAFEEMCRRFLADTEDFSEERLAEAGVDEAHRFANRQDALEACVDAIRTCILREREADV